MREVLIRLARRHEGRLIVIDALLIALMSAISPHFFTLQNLFDLLTTYAFTGILAAGLLVVLVSGGIDISFTAAASVAQYVAVSAALAFPIGWVGLFVVALGVGLALGLINALLVSHLRISSIIVTIATLNVFYGALMFITHGNYIYTLPDWLAKGLNWAIFTSVAHHADTINLQIVLLVLAFAVTWFLLARTSSGRQLYALGGNPDAAARVGCNVLRLNLLAYGFMGVAAGVASLAQVQLDQSVMPNALVGKELGVLAVVVLGGASLLGGEGTVAGTILGLVLFAVLENGLIIIGVPSYWLDFFVGLMILLAVGSTARAAMVRRKRRAIA